MCKCSLLCIHSSSSSLKTIISLAFKKLQLPCSHSSVFGKPRCTRLYLPSSLRLRCCSSWPARQQPPRQRPPTAPPARGVAWTSTKVQNTGHTSVSATHPVIGNCLPTAAQLMVTRVAWWIMAAWEPTASPRYAFLRGLSAFPSQW